MSKKIEINANLNRESKLNNTLDTTDATEQN